MNNKIDFNDLTNDQEEQEASSSPKTRDEALAARIQVLRDVGKEGGVSVEDALEIPTSVLILTLSKFPEMVEEVGIALSMVGNDQNAFAELIETMNALNTSFTNCSKELDARIPARATKSDVV